MTQHTRCAGNATGAPELSACIAGTCSTFDGRVHVWDAATREWLLPRIASLASLSDAAFLGVMVARMLEADPTKRPTFPELFVELGDRINT